jgi:chitodextrinase
MRRRSILIFAALMLASLLTSATAVAEGDGAELTVVHGIPGVTVDVYVDGAKTLPGFAPNTITDPLPLPAGTYQVDIYAEGAGPADGAHAGGPLLTAALSLASGDNVSAIAHLDAAGAPALNAFENDTNDVDAGDARLVVRHTAFAPAVDIVANGSVKLFENVSNPNEGQVDVAAGTYGVTINAAGTDTVAFDAGDVTLAEAKSTIVYAIGDLAGGSFGLLVQTIDLQVAPPNNSALTVVHGIPGVTVDVYVDGAKALPDFAPNTVTDPIALPAGAHQVDIYLAGQGPAPDKGVPEPVLSAELVLPPGGNVTAIAHLEEGGDLTVSAFLNDTTTPAPGQGRLVVRHLADAPAVDIVANGSIKLFENVTNPNEGQVDVAAGTYGVTINAAGTDTVAFDAGDVTLPEGKSTIVYAVGSLGGGTFGLLVQSIDLPSPDAYGIGTVVHGVPGLTVDVYLNGNLTLPGFAPDSVLGPIMLPATDYEVAIYPAGANPLATEPAISGMTTLPAGANASIVAHLDADGKPTLSVFVNDVSEIATGEARLVVRHTAAAPAVDIVANGSIKLFEDVTNPMEGQADVAAGTYGVTINAAGTDTVAFDAGDVTLPEGQSTIVYAIGDLAGGSFGLLVQAIPNLGPDGWFDDDNASVHQANINLIAQLGITLGTGDGTFAPEDSVTRGQMAAFLRRALGLPASATDYFTDDDDSIFEDDINAIAAAGITFGNGSGTFGPSDDVTRGQMAAFLQRAFDIPASTTDAFTDDDDSIFEDDINAIAAAGITVGTGDGKFSPSADVTRAQMATFLARSLGIGS